MNMNAAAAAAAATGNYPAMLGAMPQLQPQMVQAVAATGSAKKNSTTRLRDMTKQAKSRSDNSEATSHKESPLSDDEVEHPQKERRRHKQEEEEGENTKRQKIINRNWQTNYRRFVTRTVCEQDVCILQDAETPLWRNGPFGSRRSLCKTRAA